MLRSSAIIYDVHRHTGGTKSSYGGMACSISHALTLTKLFSLSINSLIN